MITVSMSIYNGERWIRDSISSVLEQTVDEHELLIIGDGSTDATPQLLDGFARQNSPVRVTTRENRGAVSSLNRGLREARYDRVARLDPDKW